MLIVSTPVTRLDGPRSGKRASEERALCDPRVVVGLVGLPGSLSISLGSSDVVYTVTVVGITCGSGGALEGGSKINISTILGNTTCHGDVSRTKVDSLKHVR